MPFFAPSSAVARAMVQAAISISLIAICFISFRALRRSMEQGRRPLLAYDKRKSAVSETAEAHNTDAKEINARHMLEIAQKSRNIDRIAGSHHNLGLALMAQGDARGTENPEASKFYLRAIQEFDQALTLIPRMHSAKWRVFIDVESNVSKGNALLSLKQFDAAIVQYEHSIIAAPDSWNPSGFIRNLGSIIYGMPVSASTKNSTVTFIQTRLHIYEKKKMGEAAAWCDYWLAALEETSRPSYAIRTMKAGLTQANTFDPKHEAEIRAMTLQELGKLYIRTEKFEAADEANRQADEIWQKHFAANPRDRAENQAECRCNRAVALMHFGEFQEAIQELNRALNLKPYSPGFGEWTAIENNRHILEQIVDDTAVTPEMLRQQSDMSVYAAMALRLGGRLRGTGHPEDAMRIFQEARGRLVQDMASHSSVSADSTATKRLYLGAVTLECGLPQQAAIILEQSLRELERTKNQSLQGFYLPLLACAQDRSGDPQNAEKTFRQAVTQFEGRLAHISAPERMGLFQFAQATTLYVDYAAFLARNRRTEEALLMADRARMRGIARQAVKVLTASQVSDSARKVKARLWMDPLTPQELRTLTQTHPDTLFLHYNVGRDGLALLAFGNKTPIQYFPLGDIYPQVTGQLSVWLTNLSVRGRDAEEEQMARDLGKSLLTPLYTSGLLSMKPQRLRWRRLVIIPDGELYNLPFAALILPEPGTHRLIERLPFTIAASLRQVARHLPVRRPKRNMLVICDPTGDVPISGQNRVALQGIPSDPPLTEYRGMVSQFARSDAATTMLLGNQACKAEVLHKLPDYSLLVFITHGHPSEGHEGLASYLTLAPEPSGNISNHLEASEILKSPLCARLVLLIACETAQGHLAGGEGNQGLVWAFWATGCPDVVASLWKVDPRPTNMFLSQFLQAQQQHLQDVALQQAILAVRSSFSWPGDWAAFQVYGASDQQSKMAQSPFIGNLPLPTNGL